MFLHPTGNPEIDFYGDCFSLKGLRTKQAVVTELFSLNGILWDNQFSFELVLIRRQTKDLFKAICLNQTF